MPKLYDDDDRCQLNPEKICDNCFRCLEPEAGEDYAKIEIAAVYTSDDYILDDASDGGWRPEPASRQAPTVHAHTLYGLKSGKRRV